VVNLALKKGAQIITREEGSSRSDLLLWLQKTTNKYVPAFFFMQESPYGDEDRRSSLRTTLWRENDVPIDSDIAELLPKPNPNFLRWLD